MKEIQEAIQATVKTLFNEDIELELTRPEEQFGDYTTNVAMQLAGKLKKSSREIAEQLLQVLHDQLKNDVDEIFVAGPGFINLRLTDQALIKSLNNKPTQTFKGQEIIVEFGDPNPFKEMHLGHLYTAIVGDTLSALLEASGASVKRVSYHGDVGMHIAKAIWAIKKHSKVANIQLADIFVSDTTVGSYYAKGAQAFEEDKKVAEEIKQINAHIYAQDDEQINEIYTTGCALSFKYFDKVFEELGIVFIKRYLESQSTKEGVKTVRANIGKVFEESEGAIVYKGEKLGLHTRVFINSRGLPTYEAKDLGLAELKNKDFPDASASIIITAHEQDEYFKVMLAALSEIDPGLAKKTRHIGHGFVSLTTGKMSSRTGKIYAATNLLNSVAEIVRKQFPDSKAQHDSYLAAVKYTFLKSRIGSDIVFDVQESVAIEGNSGPYLQYAHARARSILSKTQTLFPILYIANGLEAGERSLVRKISEYPEVVDKAVQELMPHYICTYLYELAQVFNRFYEHNRVIGDPRETTRLQLVQTYADTLKKGLNLLHISLPDHM